MKSKQTTKVYPLEESVEDDLGEATFFLKKFGVETFAFIRPNMRKVLFIDLRT